MQTSKWEWPWMAFRPEPFTLLISCDLYCAFYNDHCFRVVSLLRFVCNKYLKEKKILSSFIICSLLKCWHEHSSSALSCNYKMCPKAYLCKISYRYETFFTSSLKRYVVNVSFPVPFPVGWLCFKVVLALTRFLRLHRKLVLHTVLRSFVYQIRY